MREGQLLFTGIEGTSLTPEEKEFIEKESVGGVIIFERNFESPAQLAELVNNIQTLRDEYPLFIGIDHEGGRVHRLKDAFTHFPAMGDLATIGSPKTIFQIHKIMADELGAVGVNVNFAPVCDVRSEITTSAIGSRAFGHDPYEVEKFISAAIRGLQTSNVLACAKHFPGHGATKKDSHLELPYITKTMDELMEKDLIPFVKSVKSRVEFMMIGHMVVDSFNKELPATLSPEVYQYLKKTMKFQKIAITDDMDMGAIINNYSYEEAAVMALKAGADMLMYRGVPSAMKALKGINEALKKKELKKDDLSVKVKKVENTKRQYFKEYRPIFIPGIANKIKSNQSQILVDQLVQKLAL